LPYLEVACDLYGTPTYAPNLAVFLLNKIRDLAFVSNMEHFSDGKTMSWYDLAKQLTTVEIKTTTAIFNLKAKRPMNSALKVKT
jgi:dTDP-4-dehydrorhamnose reductase